MVRVVVGLIAATAGLLACSSEATSPTTVTPADSQEGTDASVNVPPTIDSKDLADSSAPVPLTQLVGLTETQARQWAADSGFTLVVTSDEPTPGALVPTVRVTLAVKDGVVTAASAG